MIDGGAEGILYSRGRRGIHGIVGGLVAGFSGQVNGYGSAGGGIFSVIGPGIGRGFMGDFRRLKRNRRIAGPI